MRDGRGTLGYGVVTDIFSDRNLEEVAGSLKVIKKQKQADREAKMNEY